MSMQPALNTSATVTADSPKGPVFPLYLEIEVGGKSKDELIAEIKSGGCDVSSWAADIMFKPAWKPGEKQMVKFARVKVRDLGFTKNPLICDIFARIRELGHSLCEPSDGPAIRLALKEQPVGDIFWTAMEQIADYEDNPFVFYVERYDDGKQWLDAYWVRLGCELVFRLCK